MRRIEFIGWDKNGKGWVHGDLTHAKRILQDEPFLEDRIMVGGYEVVPESVGLFTGLEDADGKPIYQGDIIEHFSGRYKGVVLWDDRGFFYYYGTPHFRDSEIMILGEKLKNARYYIVNSVFDNSRLIKKQK